MWHRLPEQQQRGAQVRRRAGEPPAVALTKRDDAPTSPDGAPDADSDYPAPERADETQGD